MICLIKENIDQVIFINLKYTVKKSLLFQLVAVSIDYHEHLLEAVTERCSLKST